MIICPNCKYQEIDGALFCSECGAQLVFSSTKELDAMGFEQKPEMPKPPTSPLSSDTPGKQASAPTGKPAATGVGLSLKMVNSGQVIPLTGQNEFTLGRITDGQPILPDIDLSPYEGYAEGVSRLHAAIRITERGVMIVDLGSSNGTRINGQKIVPNVNYPLKDGDIIALGRIKMQITIRR
jgi:pSer/pThr/pTyr-binding forkhead associated (FHA) protein